MVDSGALNEKGIALDSLPGAAVTKGWPNENDGAPKDPLELPMDATALLGVSGFSLFSVELASGLAAGSLFTDGEAPNMNPDFFSIVLEDRSSTFVSFIVSSAVDLEAVPKTNGDDFDEASLFEGTS